MFNVFLLIACLTVQPVVSGSAKVSSSENPMRKIIGMLQDMASELTREGEVEKEIFEKAICACEGGTAELKKVIDDSTAAIDELTAKVASGNAEKTQLIQEVSEHKTNAATATSDLDQASMLRDKEHKAFVAEEKDTSANIAALSKAIPAIEKGMGGAALMQMPGSTAKMEKFRRYCEVTKLLSNDERSEVLSFLDQGSDESSQSQTQASGEILGILKNMKDEMEKDLSELKSQETTDHESFNDLKAAKTEEISINEKSVIEKEKRIGAVALAISEDSHDLEDTTEEKANAVKFLATMDEQCATVEKDKAMREKMRAAEIAAISDAVKILNDDDALEVFKKTAFVQNTKKPNYEALLQLMSQKVKIPTIHRHSKQVKALIQLHDKRNLAMSKEEPAKKEEPIGVHEAMGESEKLVAHMIDGMVGVLHDEDVGDEHKKAWCANETEIAYKIKAEKEETIAKLTATITEEEDMLATTIAEIKALGEKIAATDKMVHEATEDRKAEHQEFVDAFATSATAIRLINKAIKRLEKFYSPEKVAKEKKAVTEAALAKAGLSLSQKRPDAALVQKLKNKMLPADFDALLQVQASKASLETSTMLRLENAIRNGVDPIVIPETPKTYEKKESGGVMGLMNDFVVDLKTDMTEAETSEKFQAKDYVRIMAEAHATRKQDVKSLHDKEATKAALDQSLADNKAKLALTEEELHNLELYIVQLHTECDFLMRNFEVRHEGRVDEETGLEAAETIVTESEVPSHKDIEERYKAEHTDDDVDEHFPGTPIDDGPDNAH